MLLHGRLARGGGGGCGEGGTGRSHGRSSASIGKEGGKRCPHRPIELNRPKSLGYYGKNLNWDGNHRRHILE